MSQNHSPAAITHQIEVLESHLAALRDPNSRQEFAGNDAISRRIRQTLDADRRRVTQGIRYWRSELVKKTGRDNVPKAKSSTEWASEQRAARAEATKKARIKQKAKRLLLEEITNETTRLNRLIQTIDKKRKEYADDWLFSIPMGQAGGVGVLSQPLLIKLTFPPRAEKGLRKARQHASNGQLYKAMLALNEAEQAINAGFQELGVVADSIQTGRKRAEIAFLLGAAMGIGLAAGGAGLELTFGETVALEMVGTGAREGTLVALQAVDPKRKLTSKEVVGAVVNTLIAGGTSAAGQFGKAMLTEPAMMILKRAGLNPSKEIVGAVISNFYSANSAQIIEAIKKIRSGEEPSYNWWAALLTPALNTLGPVGGESGKIFSQQEIRDMLANKQKGKPATAGK